DLPRICHVKSRVCRNGHPRRVERPMRRHWLMRCLGSAGGNVVVSAALAVSLVAGTPLVAQNTTDKSEQQENARKQAGELIKDAYGGLKKNQSRAARELLERARALDPSHPDLAKLEADIRKAEDAAEAAEREQRVKTLLDAAESKRKEGLLDAALQDVDRALQ